MRAQGQCHNFMLSLEGYSFNSGYMLSEVKENAQNTCPWQFMVPVMGLMTFSLSNQRQPSMPWYFMSFPQYFSHGMAKRLRAMKCCKGQAVIEPGRCDPQFGALIAGSRSHFDNQRSHHFVVYSCPLNCLLDFCLKVFVISTLIAYGV